jgi:outer membrane protein TolC
MKPVFIILSVICIQPMLAQDTLFLDSCVEISIRKHPLYKDKENILRISAMTIKDNNANYLPLVDFEGKATYQSDVLKIEVNMPDIPGFEINFPEPPLDQYNFSVNISQLLFDGGTIKNLNETERIKSDSEIKKNEIDLYALREQIDKAYFSLLMIQQTEKQLYLTINELKYKCISLRSAVTNGILSSDNLEILQAEILKLEQNLMEVSQNKKAGINILSEFMSVDLDENTRFVLPDDRVLQSDSIQIQRPENQLFQIQKQWITSNEKLLFSGRLPKLAAFAQGGYGNPGLSMINDEWNPYFIVGAKLSWRLWDRNITKRNYEILKIKNDQIELN